MTVVWDDSDFLENTQDDNKMPNVIILLLAWYTSLVVYHRNYGSTGIQL